MNIVVTLSPGTSSEKLEIGDIIKLQVFLDERIGSSGDGWEVVSESGEGWVPAGNITASAASVRSLPTDGNATKLEFEAMVHQKGPLLVGPFLLRNQVTKDEIEVGPFAVSGAEIKEETQVPKDLPWVLTGNSFGSWDWTVISLLLLAILVVGGIGVRYGLQRLKEHLTRNLTNTEKALHALANLQKYSRSKKPLQLEEWKKFSFELAGILRKYSDINFEIDSRDMTDREFLIELRAKQHAAAFVNLIDGILATITEVRYGRKELDASVVPGLLLDARRFVESTSVEPKPAEGPK